MYKNIISFCIIMMTLGASSVLAATPKVHCEGLPGCGSNDSAGNALPFVSGLIADAIQYLAALAVITLILSGILYVLSGGDEEKTKRAKTWIIWSIVGVVLSLSAWGIIGTLNNINVTL